MTSPVCRSGSNRDGLGLDAMGGRECARTSRLATAPAGCARADTQERCRDCAIRPHNATRVPTGVGHEVYAASQKSNAYPKSGLPDFAV